MSHYQNIKSTVSTSFNYLAALLQLDLTYFFSNSLWATVQQSVGIVSGLILSYIFGHFVSKTTFGEYNLVLSIIGMLTFLGLPGIDLALPKSVNEGYDRSLLTAMTLKLKLTIIGSILLIGITGLYWQQQQIPIAVALLVTAIFYPFLNSFSGYTNFLTAKRRFGASALLASFSSFFFLLTHVIAIQLTPQTAGLIVANLIGVIIPSFVGFLYSLKLMRPRTLPDPQLTAYGTFLTLISVLPWVSGNLGSVILGSLLGSEQLAVFAVASRLLTAVQKNFQAFYRPVAAKLATQSSIHHWKTINQHGGKLLLIGVGLGGIFFILSPIFISFFFPTYTEAIGYTQILSLALVPLPLAWVLNDMMIYQKRKRSQFTMSTLPQLIKISLYILVIPHWGISGLIFIILLERFTDPIIPALTLLLDTTLRKR